MTRRFVDDRAVAFVNTETQMREESLRVVTGPVRFCDRDWNPPGQSCEQDGALYLRARDGARVGKATQRAATDREGKSVASFINIRTHLLERLGHTPHRAPAQRRVAGQRRSELLARQDPKHQSCAGSGIPTVQP